MNKKIKSIKIGTGEFDASKGHNIKNALVTYDDGSVEKIEDFAEIQKAVQRLASQEGKTIEELAASGDKLTEEPIVTEKDISESVNREEIVKEIVRLNPDVEIKVDDKAADAYGSILISVPVEELVLPKGFYYSEKNGITNKNKTKSGMYTYIGVEQLTKEIEETETQEEVEEKKSLKKRLLRLTAYAVALLLAFFAGKGLFLNKEGSSQKSGNTYTIEEQITDEYGERPEEVQETFDNGISSPINYSNRMMQIANDLYYGKSVTDEDFQYAMSEINRLNFQNVVGLSNIISGGRMSGDRTPVDLYSMFPADSPDYGAIRYLCDQRTVVVSEAFDIGSQSGTRRNVNQFLVTAMNFVFNGQPIVYNSRNIYFYDLSPIGRFIAVDIAQQMLTTSPEFSCQIDGQMCDFNQLINECAETFNTVTHNLENRSNIRR